jgi:hypothetical protein
MGQWMTVVRLEKYINTQLNEQIKQRILNEFFKNWLQEKLKERGYQIEQVEKYWENAALTTLAT